MGGSRTPNHALRQLLAEAGWSQHRLAREVRHAAAAAGVVTGLDRSAVGHWLAGRRPRPPIPELVAEVLSHALGRTVSTAETRLADEPATHPRNRPDEHGGSAADEAGRTLMSLAQVSRNRRSVLADGVYTLALLAVPPFEQRVEQPAAVRGDSVRLVRAEVEAVRQIGHVLADADATFGGGYARRPLATYLAHDVAPRLRASGPATLRRAMWQTAAQLTYLCGFMCFDDEQHGLAQRYYRAALDLAREADDAASYAIILRAMSVQAHALGHHRHAVRLAQAAIDSAHQIDARGQAFLHGQLAVCLAADRDRTGAISALATAEHHLERATSPARPLIGAYHGASLAHQQAAVRALLGDRTGAATMLRASVAHRPATELRSLVISQARLAELHLDEGNRESAVAIWDRFLDNYPYVRSGRAVTALRILRYRLRPHRTDPAVRRLLARAGVVTTARTTA